MNETLHKLLGNYETFIRVIASELAASGIARSEISMMDHICYRVETLERYAIMKEQFAAIADIKGESLVSGRNIATFEFKEYIVIDDWVVPYLELPEPKEGSPYAEGLEHAELVVVGSLDKFETRHRELTFERKGMDKPINPELGFKTPKAAMKFHEQQLGAVVRIEQATF